MPNSYQPFLYDINVNSLRTDLTIEYASTDLHIEYLQKITEFPYMTIWKVISNDRRTKWMFEARNGFGTILVEQDYRQAEYRYSSVIDAIDKRLLGEAFSPFFQVVVECKLVKIGHVILHSACVQLNGVAFAFTGPSGIGKSTRAKKWCELLSAEWISGDRPDIDPVNGIVYGVPWDGKESIYRNSSYPLAVILKVKRSKTTQINEMTKTEKIQLLYSQSFIPLWDSDLAAISLNSVNRLIDQIPILEMCCDITDESILKSYELILSKLNNLRGIE